MLDFDSFLKGIKPLLEFYVSVEISRRNVNTKELNSDLTYYLLTPLLHFLRSLDEQLKMTYFDEKIHKLEEIHLQITMRVVNLFNLPISNVEAQISWGAFADVIEYLTIPICTIKTDELGITKIKLPKGRYRVDIRRYRKKIFLDLSEDKEIKVRVFDSSNLLEHLKHLVRKS